MYFVSAYYTNLILSFEFQVVHLRSALFESVAESSEKCLRYLDQ